jgi:hypothetical protein
MPVPRSLRVIRTELRMKHPLADVYVPSQSGVFFGLTADPEMVILIHEFVAGMSAGSASKCLEG